MRPRRLPPPRSAGAIFQNRAFPCTPTRLLSTAGPARPSLRDMRPYPLAKERRPRRAKQQPDARFAKFTPAGLELLATLGPRAPLCRRKCRRILVKKRAKRRAEPPRQVVAQR